jgi:feruloyl esterase
MHHCGGGPGPCHIGQGISNLTADSEHNVFTALVKWVEEGVAPKHIIASAYDEKGDLRFRRPIFPYPLFPHYISGKDPGKAESYEGVMHERGLVSIPLTK